MHHRSSFTLPPSHITLRPSPLRQHHSPDSHARHHAGERHQRLQGATSHTTWFRMFLSCFFQLTNYLHSSSGSMFPETTPHTQLLHPTLCHCCKPLLAGLMSRQQPTGNGQRRRGAADDRDDEPQETRDEANNASITTTTPHCRQTTQHPLPTLPATARRVDCGY
jgi:hypothetical protein